MNKPHKSTTVPEYFFHINNQATVFYRKNKDGQWAASVALRDSRDQFNRKTGRCVARRKWFNGKNLITTVAGTRPTYDEAAEMAGAVLINHLAFRHPGGLAWLL